MRTTSKIEFTQDSLLEDIVNSSVSYADVFDKHNIDYGNYGKLTLKEAGESVHLNPSTLISELRKKETSAIVCRNINEWDIVFLCDFIITNLHHRIKKLAPLFDDTFKGLFRKGFIRADIRKLSSDFNADIQSHIQKEQKMLYPYIKQMSLAIESGKEIHMAPFGMISKPVNALKREHLQISEMADILSRILKDISHREGNFLGAADASDSLSELMKSFRLHIHFENNILFPRATAIEKRIFKSNRKTSINKSKNKCT